MKWFFYPIFLMAVSSAGCDMKRSGGRKEDSRPGFAGEITFNAHIRPNFSDTCFACHGFDAGKRKAGLRLDTPEGAYAKLKDSDVRAIVPGKPDESAILKRIVSSDPDEVMPPPDFRKGRKIHPLPIRC